jgi:hypothetical protein
MAAPSLRELADAVKDRGRAAAARAPAGRRDAGRVPGAELLDEAPMAAWPMQGQNGESDVKSMEEMIKAAQQAAETIQKQMGEMQGKLDTIEVEGAAGGGLVKIRCSAKGRSSALPSTTACCSPAKRASSKTSSPPPSTMPAPRPIRSAARKWPACSRAWVCRRGSSCRGCWARCSSWNESNYAFD